MRSIQRKEIKGIAVIAAIIVVVGLALVVATGRLEQWFGITWFSGPQAFDKIVFVSKRSGSPQIWMMNTDGSGQKQLTTSLRLLSAPAVSPAANRITFIGMSGSASQVMTIGIEGGTPDTLTGSITPKSHAAFSPDGKKLSFAASGRVYVAELNGDNPEVVLPTEEQTHTALLDPEKRGEMPIYRDYAWGPGDSLAGVTATPDGSELLVYLNKPGGDLFTFPQPDEGRASIAGIGWASDAALLVASMNIRTTGWLIAFDVENKQAGLTEFKDYRIGKPAAASDGTQIAVPFADLKRKQFGIVATTPGTPGQQVLARGHYTDLAYSPTGGYLLATKLEDEGKKRNLIRIELSTGKTKQLTRDGASHSGAWTPHSER